MEVTYIGARTRARAIAMRREETSDRENSISVKRRKLISNEKLKSQSSTFVQTKTNDCDHIYITSAAVLEEEQSDFSTNNACTSTRPSGVEASCCSSTRSAEELLLKVSDLDQEESVEAETSAARNNLDRIESGCFRITSKIQLKTESDKPESDTTKPSLVKINASHYMVLQEEEIIPPAEAELEEFFATVQESLAKRFKDKYNYDIVNDIPLEGRFEWIQVKQGIQNDYHENEDD